MTPTETLILGAYFFILSILAVYGWHRYYLVYLYMKHKGDKVATPVVPDAWPAVTVQLPLYNEMYVVDRLVEAVCRMDTRRTGWKSRSSTTRPTRRATSPAWPRNATPPRASTSSTSIATTATGSRRARSTPR